MSHQTVGDDEEVKYSDEIFVYSCYRVWASQVETKEMQVRSLD